MDGAEQGVVRQPVTIFLAEGGEGRAVLVVCLGLESRPGEGQGGELGRFGIIRGQFSEPTRRHQGFEGDQQGLAGHGIAQPPRQGRPHAIVAPQGLPHADDGQARQPAVRPRTQHPL